MKKILLLLVTAILACVPAFAADLNGKWTTEFETPVGTQHYTYEFHVNGARLTGTAKNDRGQTAIKDGKIDGTTITFVEDYDYEGTPLHIVYTGKVDGDKISFSRVVGDFGTETMVATRVK